MSKSTRKSTPSTSTTSKLTSTTFTYVLTPIAQSSKKTIIIEADDSGDSYSDDDEMQSPIISSDETYETSHEHSDSESDSEADNEGCGFGMNLGFKI